MLDSVSSTVCLTEGAITVTPLELIPERLLDVLLDHLGLKNDAALANVLEVGPPTISKIRHKTVPVSASILIRMHEVSGLTITDLRFLMGDTRRRFPLRGPGN